MKNQKSKIKNLALVLGLMLAMAMVMPKAAAASSTRNDHTGPGSTNITRVRDRKFLIAGELKIGGVTNSEASNLNTSGNHADYNTGGSNDVDSDDASSTNYIEDYVNTTFVDARQTGLDGEDSATNYVTGPGSTNIATVRESRGAVLVGVSIGGVSNHSTTTANTGNNSSSYNTGGSNSVMSGKATSHNTHMSDVNYTNAIIRQ